MRKAAGFINRGCIKRILLHFLCWLFVVLNRLLRCIKKTSTMHPIFYLHFLCIFPRPGSRKKNKVGQAFLSEPFSLFILYKFCICVGYEYVGDSVDEKPFKSQIQRARPKLQRPKPNAHRCHIQRHWTWKSFGEPR